MSYTYDYPRASVTADVVLFRNITSNSFETLLIKRKNEPYKNHWAISGGFVNIKDELIQNAALRELREETNIEIKDIHFVGYFDTIGRDPRDRVITFAYYSLVENNEDVTAKAGDDAMDLKWVSSDELSKMVLAFDHRDIIRSAVDLLGVCEVEV